MDEDVSDEVMAATHRALCERGYADLTMQDIADGTDRSTATLHYHYDSKRDLLLAFLDHLLDSVTDRVRDPAGDTPTERLESFVDAVLTPAGPGDTREAFGTAVLELAAQAPYDEAVRDRLRTFDEYRVERVRDLVAAGIETGEFRAVDPDDAARFVVTAIDGARTNRVATGRDVARVRRLLHAYVETDLVADADAPASDAAPGRGGVTDDDAPDVDASARSDTDTDDRVVPE